MAGACNNGEMSVPEAGLPADGILSITDKQRRK